ncbi:hypothetical protein ACA910_014570 [Epithemia clementina (nom. ined.)]
MAEQLSERHTPHVDQSPPSYTKRQPAPSDPEVRLREQGKLAKVRQRGYITPLEDIRSLTSFFSVPKGDTDVRMVYNGTQSGLNMSLYAPWFSLSTVDTSLKSVGVDMWAANNDFGEIFLNFWLHPELRKYAGIDLTSLFPEELDDPARLTSPGWWKRRVLWEAWSRCAMGLTTSPFQATQSAQRVKPLALGDRTDEANVFRWDRIQLNLPGNNNYLPSEPWVSKRRSDGTLAADVHLYVNDLCKTAPSEEEAWKAASQMAKAVSFYGLQDAARKRRPPSKTPGAWAGALVQTTGESVYKLVLDERWDKVKRHIATLQGWTTKQNLDCKALEQIQGFLVYVTLTYSILMPYLKGIHLTLESWREDWDRDGWRMTPAEFALFRRERGENPVESITREHAPVTPPAMGKPVSRFVDDVTALSCLTSMDKPPRVLVRPRNLAVAALMFGDASGAGFGSSLWIQGSRLIDAEHGIWAKLYGS